MSRAVTPERRRHGSPAINGSVALLAAVRAALLTTDLCAQLGGQTYTEPETVGTPPIAVKRSLGMDRQDIQDKLAAFAA